MLILDEPTAGLDVLASRFLRDFVRAERDRGKAVVFSTHYLAEAELLCDRIGLLHRGRLLAEGTPAALRALAGDAPSLEEAFLRLVAAVSGPLADATTASVKLRDVRLVAGKELRETLRDRRTLAVMVLFPLVVYPLVSLVTAQVMAGARGPRRGHAGARRGDRPGRARRRAPAPRLAARRHGGCRRHRRRPRDASAERGRRPAPTRRRSGAAGAARAAAHGALLYDETREASRAARDRVDAGARRRRRRALPRRPSPSSARASPRAPRWAATCCRRSCRWSWW